MDFAFYVGKKKGKCEDNWVGLIVAKQEYKANGLKEKIWLREKKIKLVEEWIKALKS